MLARYGCKTAGRLPVIHPQELPLRPDHQGELPHSRHEARTIARFR